MLTRIMRAATLPKPTGPAPAEVQGILRRAAARVVNGLAAEAGPTLDASTARDAQGFSRHAGSIRCNRTAPYL